MSSLWTPDGERPVRREAPEPGAAPQEEAAAAAAGRQPTADEIAQMQELQQQLAQTPAEVVIANHAYGMFELAALHLSVQPPQLDQAQLAIDALGALLDGLQGRLGEPEAQLRDALSQLRMAYVQVKAAAEGTN